MLQRSLLRLPICRFDGPRAVVGSRRAATSVRVRVRVHGYGVVRVGTKLVEATISNGGSCSCIAQGTDGLKVPSGWRRKRRCGDSGSGYAMSGRRPFASSSSPPKPGEGDDDTFSSPSPSPPPPSTDDTAQSDDPPSPLVDPLPGSLQPYARLARLDKPIGTMLLLWPCCWSTALAAPAGCLPDARLLALFATGSFVMRGAGCTINDMWDADFDKSVARTKTRPLASGELAHTQAMGFLTAQLAAGLGVLLSLPHTSYTFQVGAASLPLVVAYPLMKRYTNWPQLVLGMTFNWGALVGWASVHGSIDWAVIGPLYCGGIAWTLVYDTLYAHQDKIDDSKLGLKSTALHFAENTKPILHGFSALAAANWMAAGYALGFTSPLYYGGCAAAYSHLVWQVRTADLDDPSNLAERFKSNNIVGATMFATCVVGNLAATA